MCIFADHRLQPGYANSYPGANVDIYMYPFTVSAVYPDVDFCAPTFTDIHPNANVHSYAFAHTNVHPGADTGNCTHVIAFVNTQFDVNWRT